MDAWTGRIGAAPKESLNRVRDGSSDEFMSSHWLTAPRSAGEIFVSPFGGKTSFRAAEFFFSSLSLFLAGNFQADAVPAFVVSCLLAYI
jgi:hypothetical protein